LNSKKRQKLVSTISNLVSTLSETEKKEVLQQILTQKNVIPVSIFSSELPGLSALVLYYKKYQKKSVKEISTLLKRDKNTIYTTLSRIKETTLKTTSQLHLPVSIFQDRKYSVLESLVFYLRHERNMKLVDIAKLLNKAPSTIKTVYWRHKKK
jgi:hypothetical protein